MKKIVLVILSVLIVSSFSAVALATHKTTASVSYQSNLVFMNDEEPAPPPSPAPDPTPAPPPEPKPY